MVGAVHVQRIPADDPVQQGVGCDRHGMARLVARVGLLVGERACHLIGDVLDELSAEDDMQQLLAAADA